MTGLAIPYEQLLAKQVDLLKEAAKILRGAKPSELPVEEPTRFELALNVVTAKALGVTIPPSLRLRVDALIE